ncbi:hypothetical protein ES703_125350 [subsurface metagenome]
MGTLNDVLKSLAGEEEAIATVALAKKAGSTEDTLRKQMSTLKNKGLVDGSTKEGWIITTSGRDSLERQEKIPLTSKDVGADTESKLKYYGQLASVEPDIILATSELIMSGDPESLDHVWTCMTEMDVPIAARRRWFNLWRNYLKQGIPPHLKEKIVGTTEEIEAGEGEGEPVSARDRGRDYIIIDDLPVNVGPGLGDYNIKDAKDIIGIRAIRSRVAGAGSGGGQQWGPQDLISILDKINEKRGDGAAAKAYVVQYTEQGAVVKEVQPGEPFVVSPPVGDKSPKTILVNPDGSTQEIQPGHPIVIKQQDNPPVAQKTVVVRQTDKGLVTEEYEAGKPIILSSGAPGGGGGIGLPFPVFGNEGKPILDSEGRPVYANLEPTLKWLGFQAEQRRADQRHDSLMGLVQTVKDNVGDGIAALKAAAEEAKEGIK